ncbi:MAG TPA: DNA polymerase III subunit delta [Candidatus Dormibacteraeota bacterium]|nr:DNA polymerase III subunit delta [Candidatus Dormibacteraeota bacterium]
MSVALLLAHGDDSYQLDQALAAFAARTGADDRAEIVPLGSPDEAAIDRAQLEAGTMGMFGVHLAVLREPLRAAGRSTGGADRLLALVRDLPDGGGLALVDLRSTRDARKPPALLGRLADAVVTRGGVVEERLAPRRGELQAWIRRHAETMGVAIEPRAAALLAERIGGAVTESDVERGEQTRVADGELKKLATYAGERPITADDVDQLVADTRPASLYAITNAVDRRDAAGGARALTRALTEGQPVLRIMAALTGRIGDLIVARELAARRATPAEIARRVGRGNVRMAERLVEAAGRYDAAELEAMLRGLFEADLAIKTQVMEAEPAVAAWLGEFVLGNPRRPTGRARG